MTDPLIHHVTGSSAAAGWAFQPADYGKAGRLGCGMEAALGRWWKQQRRRV